MPSTTSGAVLASLGVMDGSAERVTLAGPANLPLRSATVDDPPLVHVE